MHLLYKRCIEILKFDFKVQQIHYTMPDSASMRQRKELLLAAKQLDELQHWKPIKSYFYLGLSKLVLNILRWCSKVLYIHSSHDQQFLIQQNADRMITFTAHSIRVC